jgi:ribosome-binding protein aMBF1 (putative translation factor)
MEEFREKVKRVRQKKGWTQEDLAREIDVSLSTVQRWEGKGAKPIRHARRELERLFVEAGVNSGEQSAYQNAGQQRTSRGESLIGREKS